MTAVKPPPGMEVVYYLWMPSRRAVKIGTTRVFSTRLAVHRREVDAHAGLLALEFGGRALERQRHRQWGPQWHGRLGQGTSELFDLDGGLLAFVDRVRSAWVEQHPEDAPRIGWSTVAPKRLPIAAAVLGLP